ncbi:MAG: tetratricopeptide repeat protein [Planctomycetes bacterium]|nr:tetratricopeptide repeat protein [Planctomycetota bacterium]
MSRPRTTLLWLLALLGGMLTSIATPDEVQITLRDGTKVIGTLKGLADGHYVVATGGGEQRVPESRILDVELISPSSTAPTSATFGSAGGPTPESAAGALAQAPLPVLVYAPSGNPDAKKAFDAAAAADQAGKLDEAIEGYRKAAAADPWFAAARLAGAAACLRARRPREAVVWCEQILEIDPGDTRALDILVRAYAADHQPERALQMQEQLLARRCPPAEAAYRAMLLWRGAGNLVQAREAWDRYHALDPELRSPFCEEGAVWRSAEEAMTARNFDTALARYYEAQRRNPFLREKIVPRLVEVHRAQAEAAASGGLILESIEQYRILSAIDPPRAPEWHQRIYGLHAARIEKAWKEKKPVDLSAALAQIRGDLPPAETARLLGDSARSLVQAVEANLRESPWSPCIGSMLEATRGCAEVPAEVETALLLAWVHQGDAALASQDPDGALAAYGRALAADPDLHPPLDPKVAAAYQALGQRAFLRRDLASAIEAWRRVFEYKPESPEVLAQLKTAEFQRAQEEVAAARETREKLRIIEAYLAAKPPDDLARQMREQLARLTATPSIAAARVSDDLARYWPLRRGAWWKYRRGDEGEEIVRVREVDETDPEHPRFYCERSLRRGSEESVTPYTLSARPGELGVGSGGSREVLFEFPVEIGRTWSWSDGTFQYRRTYVAKDVPVKSKAGDFPKCLKMEFRTTTIVTSESPLEMTSTLYYAPEVGLVRMEVAGEGNADLNLELVCFELPAPLPETPRPPPPPGRK